MRTKKDMISMDWNQQFHWISLLMRHSVETNWKWYKSSNNCGQAILLISSFPYLLYNIQYAKLFFSFFRGTAELHTFGIGLWVIWYVCCIPTAIYCLMGHMLAIRYVLNTYTSGSIWPFAISASNQHYSQAFDFISRRILRLLDWGCPKFQWRKY